jgi:hypothetical protein
VPQDPQKSETKADKVADVLDKIAAPDWRLAHHMWSVQISVLWAIIGGLWVSLPGCIRFPSLASAWGSASPSSLPG